MARLGQRPGGPTWQPLAPLTRMRPLTTFGDMHARWGSFAVGLALILAPLLLGYETLGAILREVSAGLLVCIATLAALDRPALRYALAVPAMWLLWSARSSEDAFAGVAEAIAGALLLLLAPIPSGRRGRKAPRLPLPGERAERVQARA